MRLVASAPLRRNDPRLLAAAIVAVAVAVGVVLLPSLASNVRLGPMPGDTDTAPAPSALPAAPLLSEPPNPAFNETDPRNIIPSPETVPLKPALEPGSDGLPSTPGADTPRQIDPAAPRPMAPGAPFQRYTTDGASGSELPGY